MAYYIVAGMGRSGIAAARLILETGDSVILFDENEKADTEAAALKIFDGLETDEIDDGQAEDDAAAAGGDDVGSDSLAEEDNDDEALLEFALGELSQEQIDRALACVISPGISIHRPWVKALRDANVPVISEIELAWECSAGRLAAITGTNGKTTTTTLTGELFATVDQEVYTLGNIGIPYTGEALKMSDDAVTALEVSSFQLETIDAFRPDVSAILNITPDHLDRHGSMAEYIRLKESITANQRAEDVCVLNHEDEELRRFGEELKAREDAPRVFFFSSLHELDEGIFLKDGMITVRRNGAEAELIRTDELQIVGRHNHENAMAAAAIALNMGVPAEDVRNGLRAFKGVAHRIEFICEKEGVVYYNDSKGTNTDAAIKGIEAMDRPTVLIAGGYDKKADFHEWLSIARPKVKELVLIGVTADQIEREAREVGIENIARASSLQEAVDLARAAAGAGDAVLLSPACASWDMFRDFEQRGDMFREMVKAL